MKIIPTPGLILKPIHSYIDWENQTAEIIKEHPKEKGLWYVVEAENYGTWVTEEQLNKDYILV